MCPSYSIAERVVRQWQTNIEGGGFEGKKIAFHDPCYLGEQ